MSKVKTCFVISEIGDLNSETRKLNDEKYELVFKSVAADLGYQCTRSDRELTANQISRDIIKSLIESDLVIADISDRNPNVFYELAIRNCVNKPVIIVKNIGQKPPFDVQGKRAIDIDMTNNMQWNTAKEQLRNTINNCEIDPISASQSIVSEFSDVLTLQNISDKNVDKNTELYLDIKDIKDQLSDFYELKDELSDLAVRLAKTGKNKLEPSEPRKFVIDKNAYKTDEIIHLTITNMPSSHTLLSPIRYDIRDKNEKSVQSGYVVSSNFPLWKVASTSERGNYGIIIYDLARTLVLNFNVI